MSITGAGSGVTITSNADTISTGKANPVLPASMLRDVRGEAMTDDLRAPTEDHPRRRYELLCEKGEAEVPASRRRKPAGVTRTSERLELQEK